MTVHPKLVIFDLDGTLIKGHVRRRDGDSGPFEQVLAFNVVEPLPGCVAKVNALLDADVKVAVATNKAGVAWGHMSIDDCIAKQHAVESEFGIMAIDWSLDRFRWYEAYGHAEAPEEHGYRRDDPCRKPAPGMLLKAMADLGEEPATTLMVGDMETDQVAALRAGTRFVYAEDYFKQEWSALT